MKSKNISKYFSTKFLLVVALLVSSIILTAYTKTNPGPARVIRYAILGLSSPVMSLASSIESGVSNSVTEYFYILNVKQENITLRERLLNLQAENNKLEEIAYENKRLKDVVRFIDQTNAEGQVAGVIAYQNPVGAEAIIVDRGWKNGVEQNSAVVSGESLVGLVTELGAESSIVSLITNPLVAIDAMIQNGRVRGMTRGANNHLVWQYLSAREQVYIGSRVVTSGFDQIYPKGLVIGNITKANNQSEQLAAQIAIQPMADLDKLETVFIIQSR